ncbi:MAG: cyclic-di-AMP receptor [Anaerolineales bacterium]|nr:cyclic-di-AMP receptor [Anaerolineales bacterium]
MMKMIVAIVRDEDAAGVSQALTDSQLCVSRIASTGGFLRQGSSTLMVGVEEPNVDQAIQIIGEHCPPSVEPMLRRATLFVLNVEHFEQL